MEHAAPTLLIEAKFFDTLLIFLRDCGFIDIRVIRTFENDFSIGIPNDNLTSPVSHAHF